MTSRRLGDLPMRAPEPWPYAEDNESYQVIETHPSQSLNAVASNAAANAKRSSPIHRAISGSYVGERSATTEEAILAGRCALDSKRKQDRAQRFPSDNVKTLETLRKQCKLMLGRLDKLSDTVTKKPISNLLTGELKSTVKQRRRSSQLCDMVDKSPNNNNQSPEDMISGDASSQEMLNQNNGDRHEVSGSNNDELGYPHDEQGRNSADHFLSASHNPQSNVVDSHSDSHEQHGSTSSNPGDHDSLSHSPSQNQIEGSRRLSCTRSISSVASATSSSMEQPPRLTSLNKSQRSTKHISTMRGGGLNTNKSKATRVALNPDADSALAAKIIEIRTTMDHLSLVFDADDFLYCELAEARGALPVQAIVRGFIVRRRYWMAKKAILSFRVQGGAPMLHRTVRYDLTRAEKIDKFTRDRDNKTAHGTQQVNFNALKEYWLSIRSKRVAQRHEAEAMLTRRKNEMILLIFREWGKESHGSQSRKNVREAYRNRLVETRNRLEQAQQKLPENKRIFISRQTLTTEMHKDAAQRIRSKQNQNILKNMFQNWATILDTYREKKERATVFWSKRILPKLFDAWQHYVKIREEEIFVGHTWERESFMPKHNILKIVNFSRKIMLRRIFPRWRKYTWKMKELRTRFETHSTRRLRVFFAAWQTQSHFQHQVRSLCVQEWTEFGSKLRRWPFRAWYLWAQRRKEKTQTQEILLSAYQRRKRRILLATNLKIWKHQVIYGKTGNVHTRVELLKGLEAHKTRVFALEEHITQQKEAIENVQSLLDAEQEASAALHTKLAEKQERMLGTQFAKHHLEQEIARLQSLVDSVSMIHPGTLNRLQNIEETKRIKDHGIGAASRNKGYGSDSNGDVIGDMIGALERLKPIGVLGTIRRTTSARPNSARGSSKIPALVAAEELAAKKAREDASARGDNGAGNQEGENGSETEGEELVLLTQKDADVVLRAKHVSVLLTEMSTKGTVPAHMRSRSTEGQNKMNVKLSEAMNEASRLRTLLAFVLNGDRKILGAVNQDEEEAKEEEVEEKNIHETVEKKSTEITDDMSSADDDSKVVKEAQMPIVSVKRVRLERKRLMHDARNWSDFVQNLSTQFPMIHRKNNTAKDGVTKRLVTQRRDMKLYEDKPRSPLHLLTHRQGGEGGEKNK